MRRATSIPLLCLLSLTGWAQVTLQNAKLQNAQIGLTGSGVVLGTNDIPAELFFDFEGTAPTNLISSASLATMTHGRYLSPMTYSGSGSDFQYTRVAQETNLFRYQFNVNGTLYTGAGSNALDQIGAPTEERWQINVPLHVKSLAFAGFFKFPAFDTLGGSINIDMIVWSKGGKFFVGPQVVYDAGLVTSVRSHGSIGGSSFFGSKIPVSTNQVYYICGQNTSAGVVNLAVYDPATWTLIGESPGTSDVQEFDSIQIQTGYATNTPGTHIHINNLAVAFNDDATYPLGITQPSTLTNRDDYIGLVNSWQMNEGTSAALFDDYAGSSTGYLLCNNSTWTTGDDGQPAKVFDGSTETAAGSSQGNFTTLGWTATLRFDWTGNDPVTLMGYGDSDVAGWFLGISAGQPYIKTSQSGAEQLLYQPGHVITTGVTYDIEAVTHPDGSGEIYTNGVVCSSVPAGTLIAPTASGKSFKLGSYDGASQFFNGWMQQGGLYDRSKSAEEVLRRHNHAP